MIEQFAVLIVIVPFLSALVISLIGWFRPERCFPAAFFSLLVTLGLAVRVCIHVLQSGSLTYRLGGWPPPWGIVYHIDYLNCIILVVICLVSFLNLAGAKALIKESFPGRTGTFHALYLLFTTGLLGIVITGDAFNLYVLLEIASLTGYALLGLGHKRAPLSALQYVFMGTIGASFYLLGVGYLYMATGSLNMADIAGILPDLYSSRTVLFAFLFILTGVFVKMALFPVHGWLPNAYAHSPPAVGGLIAPLTTKVMVYVMVRMLLTVFTPSYTLPFTLLRQALIWMAVAAIVCGSILALSQKNLKRMLTYVIVAEVGYMVGGFWLGNRSGMSGAILHIVNDAMMTLCLFLSAMVLQYKRKADKLVDMQGLFQKMPFTMGAFIIAGLSIVGVPPTCGFFSKWYLLSGGIAAGQYGFVSALIFSSLVNAVLLFRIIEIGYFQPAGVHHGRETAAIDGAWQGMDEAPVNMLVPLMLSAVTLVLLGIFSGDLIMKAIDPALPATIFS